MRRDLLYLGAIAATTMLLVAFSYGHLLAAIAAVYALTLRGLARVVSTDEGRQRRRQRT
ncbi:hypothetical protein [Solirubrobacter soli]|uniref:hypothetical protein n=1 Tax=Solirubrobacter soli TaxID=363832 RepID=UPI00040972F3|nr:hypothetical protein [Solirubrobacter soli]